MGKTAIATIPKPGKEAAKIQKMFSDISQRYDLLNHLLSGGTDIAWRNTIVRDVLEPKHRMILDVACGTGDLAITLKKAANPQAKVYGADFTHNMLTIADQKKPAGGRDGVYWIEADGLKLPFDDNQFDLLTIAFGIRNIESLEGALEEFLRVLKPGGKLAILEFSQPENFLVRNVYNPYFLHVLPRIGAALSQKSAYMYLPFSVLHFPKRHELAKIMKRCGYAKVKHAALTLGIAAIHIGTKAE